MPDHKPKETTRGQRIQEYCTILWGKSDSGYDLDIETDHHMYYQGFIRKDNGYCFGPPIIATMLCSSADKAYDEMEKELAFYCKQKSSGNQPGELECYHSENEETRLIIGNVIDEFDRRRCDAAGAKSDA
jgi:hypothetical protein